ncbi:MAG: exo-alpha-sialidase [Bacteroidetes bacterium]|nr:exo-alpha-sialidase [Bacteroidota bacterium]
MVNSRVRDAGYRWEHTSSDEGRTWTSRPDTQLVDPAVNAALVREGDLLYFANAAHPQARQDLVLRRRHVADPRWTVVDTLHRGSAAYVTATMLRVHERPLMGLAFERGDYAEIVFRRLDPNAPLAE